MDTSACPGLWDQPGRSQGQVWLGWMPRAAPSTCLSTQQLPLFFPLPEMLIFHSPSQKLSQGLGQAVGGGELRPGCCTSQWLSPPSGLAGASHPLHSRV